MIGLIRALFGFLRLLGPERSSDLGGWLLRTASPLIPVNRVALANIRAAFPGMDEAEVRRIASLSPFAKNAEAPGAPAAEPAGAGAARPRPTGLLLAQRCRGPSGSTGCRAHV